MSGEKGRGNRRGRGKIRRPTATELALWKQAVRHTEKLPAAERVIEEITEIRTTRKTPGENSVAHAPQTFVPEHLFVPAAPRLPVSTDLAEHPVQRLQSDLKGLDRRTARRLSRGEREPQARLDLHGKTLESAHQALIRFISQSHEKGLRLVLVITGKGGNYQKRAIDRARRGFEMPQKFGVLKSSVPRWLSQPPLSAIITGVYDAHARHGGAGALYVYLRKSGAER